MTDLYKVTVEEKNGVELDFREELELRASLIFLSSLLFPGIDNVKGALEDLKENFDFANATGFEVFNEDALDQTQTNGWDTVLNDTTEVEKKSGKYVIFWSIEAGQSDKQKAVGTRVQWKRDSLTGWNTLMDLRSGVSVDDEFAPRSGFRIVELLVDDFIDIRVQFGQTDDGGTAYIKNTSVLLFKVGEL